MCDYWYTLIWQMTASLSTFIKASSWIHNTDTNMSCITLNISLIKMITIIINGNHRAQHNTNIQKHDKKWFLAQILLRMLIVAQIQHGMNILSPLWLSTSNDFDSRLAVMWGSAWKQHLLVQSFPLTINKSESSVLFHDFHVSKSSKVHFFCPEKLWRAWWNIFGVSIAVVSKVCCSNHKEVQVKAWFGDL